MLFQNLISDEGQTLANSLPASERLREANRQYVDQFRKNLLELSSDNVLSHRIKQAHASSRKSKGTYSDLINYLMVGCIKDPSKLQIQLPQELDLQQLGREIILPLLEGQVRTGNEQLSAGVLHWPSGKLSFTSPSGHSARSAQGHVSLRMDAGTVFAACFHTHPVEPGGQKNISLRLSPKDMFELEIGMFGASFVASQEGALFALKRHGFASCRSAGEALAIIRGEEKKHLNGWGWTEGRRVKAFTASVCRKFNYDLYEIADLTTMIAKRIRL